MLASVLKSLFDGTLLVVMFVAGVAAMIFSFFRAILAPKRKSEAREETEKLRVDAEKVIAERNARLDEQIAQIKAKVAEQKKARSIDIANEIIKRN